MAGGGWARPEPARKDRCDAGAFVQYDGDVSGAGARGLDVARLNFSHGSHEQKAELIRMVRAVAREEGTADLHSGRSAGPKIRTGRLVGWAKAVMLETGNC